MFVVPLTRDRRVLYVSTAVGITAWAAALAWLAAALRPVESYLISYYVADYRFGFIRRGLAGELAGPIDDQGFFLRATVLRWTVTALYLAILLTLSVLVLRGGRSERRAMVALVVPVLSFGVPFAVFSARPDLLGAAAVMALAIGVAVRPRSTPVWGAAYGAFTAVLALLHEAIPLEFPVGAVLAIYLLAPAMPGARRRLSATLAVGPGLLAAVVVAVFGRRDTADLLCSQVPHRQMPMMVSFKEFTHYLHTGQLRHQDYHGWVCRRYLPLYDSSALDGLSTVLGKGTGGLMFSLTAGAVGLAACIAAVQYLSGVSFFGFISGLRGRWVAPLVALALMVPVFITGFDWTRWMLVIAFDITMVYLLYLRDRPELDEPPTRRNVVGFVAIVVAFAALPLGLLPGGST